MKQGCSTKFGRIITSAMLLVATVGTVISSPPNLLADCTPSPAGLVAWWPGEGNAMDLIGTNNGAVTAGTVTYATAEVNQGFSFDGGANRILVSDSSTLNFGANQDFSIEAWIKPESALTTGNVMSIVDKRAYVGGNDVGYEFNLDNNRIHCRLSDSTGLGYGPAGPVLTDGNFHHVAVTVVRNSTTGGHLYVDGQVVLTFDPTGKMGDLTNPGPLRIGNHMDSGYNSFFKGLIDEVSLYNRALSTNEIAAIYAAGNAGKCAPMVASCVVPPANLTAWWGAENNALDSVGTNNGSPVGGISYTNGKDGQAFLFNQTSSYISVPASPSLNIGTGNGLTIEAWVKPQSAVLAPIIEWDSASTDGLQLWVEGYGTLLYANIKDTAGNAHTISFPYTFDTNNFQHVAVTYDKSSGLARLFINGAIVASVNFGTITPQTSYPANIGRRTGQPIGLNDTYGGLIDELSLYNRALSTNEIAAIYAAGSAGKCLPATPVVISGPITNSANGHSYFLLGGSSWTEAEAKAVALGGHLVTINDASENAWVLSTFGAGGTRALWIGLNDAASEGTFTWVSGDAASYRNWSSGEPNNYGGNENYAYMGYPTFADGTWNDQPDSGYNPASGADNRPYMFGVVEISSNTNTTPQPPVITDFFPKLATNGTLVTLTGTNFSPVAASNIVYFGAVRAFVMAASSTSLTVIVPTGATFAPITVTVNGFTAYSDLLFEPTFTGYGPPISANSFKPSFNLAAGNGPGSAVIADLDGDGKPDFAEVNGSSHTLSLYRNISSGGTLSAASFAPRVDLPFPANGIGGDPYRLRVADLDGDGKLDLIACEVYGSRVSIYRNLAVPGSLTTNSFAAGFNLNTGSDCRFAIATDFDNDGRVDIVALNYGDKTISIFKNIGSGGGLTAASFAPPVILAAPGGPYEAVAEDFNGDGKPDLAVANSDGGTVSVYQNLALTGVITTNSFAPRFDLPTGNTTATIVAVDLDGDGKLDLVAGSVQSHTISVFRNLSTGNLLTTNSFAARVDFLTDDWTHTLAIADFNGDGKPDINVVGELPSRMSIFQNLSTAGAFTSASLGSRMDFGTGWNAWGVAAGDLDGDGQPDIVFCNDYDATVQIYQNASSSVSQPTSLPPVITDFFPKSATNGTVVTLTGTNFSPVAASNIVYFGAVRATVGFASPTNLQLNLPVGATFAPPTVTVGGLTGTAKNSFTPTFAGSGLISAANFAPRFNLTSGNGPVGTVIADLDGDGKPDMAIADGNSHTVSVYRNISSSGTLTPGSFGPRVVLPGVTGTTTPYMIVAADLDGDGRLDLVTTEVSANLVSVFRNLATPGSLSSNSFAPRVSFTVGSGPRALAVADLDGDGRPEIVSANYGSSTVSILRNVSSPGPISSNSFAPRLDLSAGSGAHGLVVADLDGDGKPDIATANAATTTISLLRNLATPGSLTSASFAPAVVLAGPTYPHFLRAADLDGDGKLELILTSYLGQSVSIYRNLATPGTLTTGSFAPRVEFALGARGHTVSIGDLNGDSKPDVVVDCEIPDRVCVFQNLSVPGSFTSGSFAARVDLPGGYNVWGSSVGDLDGDSRPDILVANSYDNNISIYRNLGSLPPTIMQQPASQSVVLGDRVTFNVLATGTSPFSYQWRFNGHTITGATNSSFVLPEAQLAQAGDYSVTVANAAGSVLSSNATLTVTVPVCTTAPAGIVGWWTSDAVTSDSVSTNHATLIGGNNYANGKVGLGFEFKGYTNFARIPKSPTLDVGMSSGFTIEGWIKPKNVTAFHPMWEWNSGVQGGAIGSHFWLGHLPSSSGELYANVMGTDGTSHAFWSANGMVATNIAQHVALTYDKASGLALIILNGKIVAQANLGSFTPKTDLDVYVGRRPSDYPGDWTYNTWFDGVVDEFSLYNRALTTNEIAAIYAARGAGKCPLPPTVLSVTPTNWYVNEGSTVSYTATAVGSPVLTFQWQHNGLDIPDATSSTLTLSNLVYTQAGNYAVVVSNPAGLATSSNVVLRVNRAPVADASATDTLAISPNGTNAVVVLDGSRSSDPDGDALTYAWFNFGDTNAFATSIVAMESLPVGTNQVILTVNDGMAWNSQSIAIEVITTSQALDRLIALVQSGSDNTQPLVASLRAALAAIDRSQPAVAINQLEAFINKVHVQIEPSDPVLAAQLIADAQAIIDALNGGTSVAVASVEITSLTPDHHGKAHLKIKGIKGRVHVIETSTNMVDWVPVGVATQSSDDTFEFDDQGAQDTGARFYRVISPK